VTAPAALVIVPTFNERDNLPVLLEVLMLQANVNVLVVDDHSPDGTGAVADALARSNAGRIDVMHCIERPGLGRSYINGILSALQRPVDVICQMDADLSHDPRHLPSLIAATAGADIVIGSRYAGRGDRELAAPPPDSQPRREHLYPRSDAAESVGLHERLPLLAPCSGREVAARSVHL
jgi:glycosyltransferase involved in cell wall biosynthesis